MSFTVVIPARFASTRLPGKLLLDLAGKTVLQHVYDRALGSGAKQVIIATDSSEIVAAANKFSAEVIMTSADHHSGTDRIAEVASFRQLTDDEVIVNVQGDEPLIDPANINRVAENLVQYKEASIATLCSAIDDFNEILNPNLVKVVMDNNGYALYFSRAPVPWYRDQFSALTDQKPLAVELSKLDVGYYCHMGIYAYRAGFLKTYVALDQSQLEKAEALEQLRALSNGYKIHVGITERGQSIGIDTEEDYQKVKDMMAQN